MKRLVLKTLLMVAAIGQFSSVSTSAYAEDGTRFRQLIDEALMAYQSKRYDEAITKFEAAFQIRQEPEIMYNLARSHEKALHRRAAIESYQKFLSMPGTTAALRTSALAAIEALEAERAALTARENRQTKRAEPEPARPSDALPAASPMTTTRSDRSTAATLTTSPRAEASNGPAYVLFGASGLAVVGAITFGLLSSNAGDDAAAFCQTTTDRRLCLTGSEEALDRQKTFGILSDISTATSIVAAGVGLYLLLSSGAGEPNDADDPGDELTSSIKLHPSFGFEHASVGLTGSF